MRTQPGRSSPVRSYELGGRTTRSTKGTCLAPSIRRVRARRPRRRRRRRAARPSVTRRLMAGPAMTDRLTVRWEVCQTAAQVAAVLRTRAGRAGRSLARKPARSPKAGFRMTRTRKPRDGRVRRGAYSSGWRDMPAGSRPAASQPMTTAASGMPTRITSRLVSGMLDSEDRPSSWLLRKKTITAR